MNLGSRRKFLASAAAVIGLPYLESLGWRRAHAQTAPSSPMRFMAVFTPNGFHMPDWTPTKTGTGWDMPHILAPLEPVIE